MESKKPFKFADFEDPNRCSFCREEITEGDQKRGMVLHVKVAPIWALHPETGERLGQLQPEGPKNRYLHPRGCGETYAKKQLVCIKCNYWSMSEKGGGLCLCMCHPPKNANGCSFFDTDLERAGGK